MLSVIYFTISTWLTYNLAMKAALPLAAADYHSDGPRQWHCCVVQSWPQSDRQQRIWRALTSYRTCAVKDGYISHEYYIIKYSPLVGYVKWVIQDLTCHMTYIGRYSEILGKLFKMFLLKLITYMYPQAKVALPNLQSPPVFPFLTGSYAGAGGSSGTFGGGVGSLVSSETKSSSVKRWQLQ